MAAAGLQVFSSTSTLRAYPHPHPHSHLLLLRRRQHRPAAFARSREPTVAHDHCRLCMRSLTAVRGRKGTTYTLHTRPSILCSALSDGDLPDSPAVFPRINIRDPYKRLGISREASEEEIREAHSFLTRKYSEHEKSRASIEAAYDKIIMESLRERRRPKFDLQSKLKQKYAQLPSWLRNTSNIYDVPSTKVIIMRAIFFAFLGVWSVLNPTQIGPTFQVAVSLAGCIYFLYDRNRVKWKVGLFGFGSFVVGWILASIIVAFLPAIYPQSWGIELVSALISYVFLWFVCTFFSNAVRA